MAEYLCTKDLVIKRDGAILGYITTEESRTTDSILKASGLKRLPDGGSTSEVIESVPTIIYTYHPYSWRKDRSTIGKSVSLPELLKAIRSFHEQE